MNNAARHRVTPWRLILVSLLALLGGCSGGEGGGLSLGGGLTIGGGALSGTGTLGVSLTDDACGFSAVNVTVTKVRVHRSATASETDAGWTDLTLSPARKINLLTLTNGVLTTLGDLPLAAGHYSQLRLVLDSNATSTVANSVVPTGSAGEIPLGTPSAAQSGIKLINEFDVTAGQRTDLVLDFDACKSVVPRGNGAFFLVPVIRVVPFTFNGIDGFVNTTLLASNVAVSAQINGSVVASTVPNAQTGEFVLARLASGNYDVVITADGRTTGVITGVTVPSSGVVFVSTNVTPINLPVSIGRVLSGTELLNPANTAVAAFVTAKQTVGTTLVSVKSQAADLLTGAYSLNLPVAAPLLGQFASGILPIPLVAQTGSAGKYTAEASASGYASQSVSVDLSSNNVVQNFTLVP